MKKLMPEETKLVGKLLFTPGSTALIADPIQERIVWLTENVLTRLASSRTEGDWEIIFLDPGDGRLWERSYPSSGSMGGGPFSLEIISEDEARKKYDF